MFYTHEFGDNHYDVNASFLNMPATSWTTRGVDIGRDAVVFGLGANYKLGENTDLFLDYSLSAMQSQISQGVNLGVRFAW